jgi:hypothetical protein
MFKFKPLNEWEIWRHVSAVCKKWKVDAKQEEKMLLLDALNLGFRWNMSSWVNYCLFPYPIPPQKWNSMGIAKLTINISNITSLAPVILMRSWDRDKTRESDVKKRLIHHSNSNGKELIICIYINIYITHVDLLYIYIHSSKQIIIVIYHIHSYSMCRCVLRTSHLLLAQKRIRLFRNVRENYRLPLNNSWSEGPPVYNYIWGSAKS